MDILQELWLQFGLAGILAGAAYKALDLAVIYVKGKAKPEKSDPGINGSSPQPTDSLSRRAFDQSVKNGQILEEVKTQVARLSKVVVDGNGQPPLTDRVTRVETLLSSHVVDQGLHTKEK